MTIFIFFESRYNDLTNYLNNENNTQLIMGEIKWFSSFIKHLIENNHMIYICNNLNKFLNTYNNIKIKNVPYFLIMDYLTIPISMQYLKNDINKIFCMCYWGRDENTIKDINNISLKNVLTPFNYNKQNTYLGYDICVKK